MFNVFTGSSRLDAIISFCVRKPRLASCYAPETNCKIESTLVTLALRKKICIIRVLFSDPITYGPGEGGHVQHAK